ncbi:MAG: glycosyltransferase family 39 protein [Candidatus Uhrbacteria bacterium]
MVSETRRDLIMLAVASLLFFCSTQILSFISPVFSSPDETANAFFSETLATQGKLYSFESLNAVLGDVLYPRSIISVEGRLLPIGFLGLPILFGCLIWLFGNWSLPFWTPLFAILAVFAWYAITRRLFDRRIGLLSALLLLIFPAWWYWSARPLMPNVLFVSLLIFSVFFLLIQPIKFWQKKIGWLDLILAGGFFALALWVRTFEVLWLTPVIFFSLIILRKYLSWKSVVLFFVSSAIAMLPFLFFNNSLYGAPWKTGYTVSPAVVQNVQSVQEDQSDSPSSLSSLSSSSTVPLLPFGLHPRTAAKNILNYGFLMFWWLTIPAIIGLVLVWPRRVLKDEKRSWRWCYFAVLAVSAIWLGLVYGSWSIFDNPDKSAVTIGNSYIRYWLPVFVLLTPLIATAVANLTVLPFVQKKRVMISVVCFLVFFGLSTHAVFFASDDSLWPMRTRLVEVANTHEWVLQLTEANAVIVVDRADKLFFPDRRVRYPLRDEATYDLLPRIALRAPLYYYGITFPQIDLAYLNNDKLKNLGLGIELIETFGEESLYRIIVLNLDYPAVGGL